MENSKENIHFYIRAQRVNVGGRKGKREKAVLETVTILPTNCKIPVMSPSPTYKPTFPLTVISPSRIELSSPLFFTF